MENLSVFDDLKSNTKIMPWYKRTKNAIKKHRAQNLRHNLKPKPVDVEK